MRTQFGCHFFFLRGILLGVPVTLTVGLGHPIKGREWKTQCLSGWKENGMPQLKGFPPTRHLNQNVTHEIKWVVTLIRTVLHHDTQLQWPLSDKNRSAYMKMWIYENMKIWIFQYMNIWIYENMNIWIYENMNIWIYEYMNIWIYEYMNINIWIYIYKYEYIWIYESWIYEYMNIWIYEYMNLWIYEFMNIWIYEY